MDDYPSKMLVDRFGNTYLTGTIITANNGNDIVTVKYNSSGVQQWAAEYNQTSNINDISSSIALDSIGNVYIAGKSGFNLGPYSTITIKYNNSGVQQWANVYNISGNPDGGPGDIAVDKSGNVYVGGGYGPTYGTGAALLLKYNPNGSLIWSRTYAPFGRTSYYHSIVIDRLNDVCLTGIYFTQYRQHCLTAKYDSSGVFQWAGIYNNDSNGALVRLGLDSTNNVYVTGVTVIGNANESYLTIKYSSSGIQQWIRTYSGPHISGLNNARDVVIDNLNNIYVTGVSLESGNNYALATIKYNSSGDSLWVRRYTGFSSTNWNSIAIDSSANIYITGTVSGNITTLKYNSSGTQQWVTSYTGQGVDIAVDKNNNVYVSGANINGNGFDYITIKYSQLLGLKQISNTVPKEYILNQNFPNPFNPSTSFKFQIPKTENIRIAIYDVQGRKVAELVNEKLTPGVYLVSWNGLPPIL